MEEDDEDKFEPKLQTENAGGGGSGGKTRIGANTPDDNSKRVCIDNNLTVKELAQKLGVSDIVVIKQLFMRGILRTVNQIVEIECARSLAIDMCYEVVDLPNALDET